jgi:hypothetical protein
VSADPRRDVAAAASANPIGRLEQLVADLHRQLAALRNRPVPVGNGAPTTDPTTLAEGTEYIDRSGMRKYYVVSAGWRYVNLT